MSTEETAEQVADDGLTLKQRIALWPGEKRKRWIFQNCLFGHGLMEMKSYRHTGSYGVNRVKTVYTCDCGYHLELFVPREMALKVVDEEYLPPLPVEDDQGQTAATTG